MTSFHFMDIIGKKLDKNWTSLEKNRHSAALDKTLMRGSISIRYNGDVRRYVAKLDFASLRSGVRSPYAPPQLIWQVWKRTCQFCFLVEGSRTSQGRNSSANCYGPNVGDVRSQRICEANAHRSSSSSTMNPRAGTLGFFLMKSCLSQKTALNRQVNSKLNTPSVL